MFAVPFVKHLYLWLKALVEHREGSKSQALLSVLAVPPPITYVIVWVLSLNSAFAIRCVLSYLALDAVSVDSYFTEKSLITTTLEDVLYLTWCDRPAIFSSLYCFLTECTNDSWTSEIVLGKKILLLRAQMQSDFHESGLLYVPQVNIFLKENRDLLSFKI